jgi:hypothetical protein
MRNREPRMVSTYLSYRLYTADLAKTVSRTLKDPQIAREAEYYRDNIGKVTTVDEFLNDRRLYTYAMKAYGLEDMTYAKAFMRKVLQSDVTDQDSFVRKLVDQRYLTFARAFNFLSDGKVDPGFVLAQESADETETVGLYSEQRVLKGAAVATEVDYYQTKMATITSVDQLLADQRLFDFALKAYGINPDYASKPAMREVLLSDLSDPTSAANVFASRSDPPDTRYQKLAAAFSFASDGSAGPDGAQTATQITDTIYFNYEATGNGMSPAAAAFKTSLYQSQIADITTVDEFLANTKLRDYALTAVALDPILIGNDTLRDILTSDLSDPDSVANSQTNYKALASMFNFNIDGEVPDGVPVQTEVQEKTLTDFYLANYALKAQSAEKTDTDYYKLWMDTVFTVDDLVNDTKLFNYVVKAFGLDPAQESRSKIKQVLMSDPNDPTSFARMQRDSRYTDLAAAFNFNDAGEAQGPLRAQLSSAKTSIVSLYTATLGELDIDKSRGQTETDYYRATIDTIGSVDELIKDKRLVAYIKKAYGFEKETISDQTLRQILTSDLYDTKSFVNRSENYKYRDLASAFNFDTDGKLKRVTVGLAQDSDELLRTQDMYIRQTLEEQAGAENEGVRLALYFQRKASAITGPYSVLADKALLEVVLTALGLPDAVAQADVDTQAKMLEKRIDFEDFKDPAKVEKFLSRFTTLYDLENPQATQGQSVPSILLGGQDTSTFFGIDILSSLQTLKLRV